MLIPFKRKFNKVKKNVDAPFIHYKFGLNNR